MEAVCRVILIEPHKTGRFSADIIVQIFRAGTYRHVVIHEGCTFGTREKALEYLVDDLRGRLSYRRSLAIVEAAP
jgi:hypothetical protein